MPEFGWSLGSNEAGGYREEIKRSGSNLKEVNALVGFLFWFSNNWNTIKHWWQTPQSEHTNIPGDDTW